DSTDVTVQSTYKCSPAAGYDTIGSITVTLTQPPGGTNTGSGSASYPDVLCDNRVHRISVTVTADTGSTFTVGRAHATATLNNAVGLIVARASRDIRIK